MSVCGVQPLQLEQNADLIPIVYTWYPNGTPSAFGTPQDLTGYSCSMMVRVSPTDLSAPVVTYTPTLGGAAGTVTINVTAAQTNVLFPLLPYGVNGAIGYYDILLTSPGGVKTRFVDHSPLEVSPAVTR